MRVLASLVWSTCVGVGLVACGEAGAPPTGPRLAIAVAPLDLADVADACYAIAVYDVARADITPAALVWSQGSICASRYGDGQGSVSYVGTCDADPDGRVNSVALVLEGLCAAPGCDPSDAGDPATLPASRYRNPCPADAPCVLERPCRADADTAVAFDLTIMRSAGQGFFDVAVTFDDVFCSAKLDCVPELLHRPGGPRDLTAVLALACSSGVGGHTCMGVDPVRLDCGAYGAWSFDPMQGPGNIPSSSPLVYAAAVYRGDEAFTDFEKSFWTVALGLDVSRFAAAQRCTLSWAATASDGPLPGGATPPGTTYPRITWSRDVVVGGQLACGHYGLDEVPPGEALAPVATGYLDIAESWAPAREYCHSLCGADAPDCSDVADPCLEPRCNPATGRCDLRKQSPECNLYCPCPEGTSPSGSGFASDGPTAIYQLEVCLDAYPFPAAQSDAGDAYFSTVSGAFDEAEQQLSWPCQRILDGPAEHGLDGDLAADQQRCDQAMCANILDVLRVPGAAGPACACLPGVDASTVTFPQDALPALLQFANCLAPYPFPAAKSQTLEALRRARAGDLAGASAVLGFPMTRILDGASDPAQRECFEAMGSNLAAVMVGPETCYDDAGGHGERLGAGPCVITCYEGFHLVTLSAPVATAFCESDPVVVTTFDELVAALQLAATSHTRVVLGNDIDLALASGARRSGALVEELVGTLDGRGHALVGWKSDQAIIQHGQLGARILDLRVVTDVDTGSGWNNRTGGVIAAIDGSLVDGVRASGSLVFHCTEGDPWGVGGVVGQVNGGLVRRSSFEGTVDGTTCGSVGGLVGSIYPDGEMIADAYVVGSVHGGVGTGGVLGGAGQGGGVRNVFFRGDVSGTILVGGVVGLLYGSVTNAYAAGTVTGERLVGRVAGGLTDAGLIDNSYGEGLTGTLRGVGEYTYGDGYGQVVNGAGLVPTLADIYDAAIDLWDDAVWSKDPARLVDPTLLPSAP